ncbi:MAG: cytoplasmic protein [Phycisphaerae bacterium]|nr:cytoplasmic protein [Phycisphaerae bacterium]
MDHPSRQFIGEEVRPQPGSFAATAMARGQPGVPQAFTWRGESFRVVELLRQWASTGPCSHGSGERYVRRHWFEVRVAPDGIMTLYCDRQARDRRHPKARWWLYCREE